MARETFASSELELRARVADLEADRDAYRELFHEAVHALHDVTRERDQARRQIAQLVAELRTLIGAAREHTAARTRKAAAA